MDNIGRVGQLYNLVCKPELNGSWVVLESYVAEDEQYEVRVLSAPNHSAGDDVVHYVKPSNVQYFQSETFASKYPAAATQKGSHIRNKYKPGTILDFTDVEIPLQTVELEFINFHKPCCVVGAACSTDLADRPTTKMPNGAAFNPSLSSYMMECRNIDFVNEYAACPEGDQITLCRCQMDRLVLGWGPASDEPAKVFAENCVIMKVTHEGSAGVTVSSNSEVTMINCEISNCPTGALLCEGAKATFIHCTFTNCETGIDAHCNNELKIINCTFTGCQRAVKIHRGGNIHMVGCRVEDCGLLAVEVQALKTARMRIENCVFTKCARGLLVSTGKVQLTLINSSFTENVVYGVCFLLNLLGSIDISDCTIRDNTKQNMLNLCGSECTVTIDNVEQECADVESRIDQFHQVGYPEIFGVEVDQTVSRSGLNSWEMTKWKRTMKDCGITGYKIECANCLKVEALDEKFKACGKCEKEVYCGKECQVARWKVHKKECVKKLV